MPSMPTSAATKVRAPAPARTHMSVRRFIAIAGCGSALAFGAASLAPGDAPVLKAVAPANAEAFQGGWDRDHYWVKVSAGEVASGAVTLACARYLRVPDKSDICPILSQAAKQIIGGHHGFWAEVWPGKCRFMPYPRCDISRIRMGVW